MKILYVTDLHNEFDKFRIILEYAQKSRPDLLVTSGDLIDFAFMKYEKGRMTPLSRLYPFEAHQQMAEILMQYTQQTEPRLVKLSPLERIRTLPIVAEKIIDNPLEGIPEGLEELAERYLSSLDWAEGNMDIQYDLLQSLLKESGIKSKVIPGNYDKDLQETSLSEEDLHKKVMEHKNIKIAGFGGANDFLYGDIIPPGIPVEITIPFNEYKDPLGRTISEIFNYMIKEKPDIAFTHIPPKGLTDFVFDNSHLQILINKGILSKHSSQEEIQHALEDPNIRSMFEKGSPGLRSYIEQGHTKLLCCGHIHGGVGVQKIDTQKGPVLIFNGGSLKKGYFGEITLNDETGEVEKIELYQIKSKLIALSDEDFNPKLDVDNIQLLMQYFLDEEGELKKIKLNFDPNDSNDY